MGIAGSYYPNSNSEILIDRRIGWKYGPNFEIGIGSTVAVSANDRVYIVGGYQNYDFTKVFMLASPTSQWKEIGIMNRVRYYHAACAIYNKIWVFGGHSNTTDVVEVFDISSGISMDTPIIFNSSIGMRYPSAAVVKIP